MLAFRFDDLLLSWVSEEDVLQLLVGDEAGTDGVVVHAFFPLIGQILCDVEIGVLGRFDQVSVHFKGERSQVAIVYSSPLHDLFPHVLPQGFDDEVELGFGIKWFDWFIGPGLGRLVLSWVILGVADYPTSNDSYQA